MTGTGKPWTADEQLHAGRENLDPEHVSRYDSKEDADAPRELEMLLDVGVPNASTVVDLGAGTGQFTLAAAKMFERVVAVDVSGPMLEFLKAKLEAEGVSNVDCVAAGFLTYEHQGAPVDLVYSRYALHHIPDFWKALALSRIAAFLKPGGIFRLWDIVYGFEPALAEAGLDRWVHSMPEEAPEDDWDRADVEEHIRDEHSTFTWLLEPMLDRAGFDIWRVELSEDGIFARYVCVRR